MEALLHTTFLSENPESFGQITSARPVATGAWAVAAHGYALPDGTHPLFTAEEPGVLGLLQEVYDGILTPGEDHIRPLRHTFGESDGRQDHPVARYAAVLAQIAAMDMLSAPSSVSLPCNALADKLSCAVADKLDDFRVHMNRLSSEGDLPPDAFSVAIAACRITEQGDAYTVDLLGAGDYGFFLLDEQGLSPLWPASVPPLSPVGMGRMPHRSVRLTPNGPFAVVILSGRLFASDEGEGAWPAGHRWRERMKREELLLRTVAMAPVEEDFGDRAARAYVGQTAAEDSVTGAVLYCRGTYEELYAMCKSRLRCMEDLMALLPDGYDADHPDEHPPLASVENEFVHAAFTAHPELLQRTADRLSEMVLSLLQREDTAAEVDRSPDRLTYADVYEVFAHFDEENREDRQQIETNRRIIRDLLCDHWITLRPVLCPDEACDEVEPTYGAACERAYASCCRMNARLTSLLNDRKKALSDMISLLDESLRILRASGDDWARGRAGDANALAWMARMKDQWPGALSAMEGGWAEGSEAYRCLQSAYTAERENLFLRDTHPEEGVWRSTYEAIQNGRLPRGSWNLYAERCVEVEDGMTGDAYAELLLVLRTVSESIRVLLERVEGRAADRRAAHRIAGNEARQTACLRGVLRRDPAWEACAEILTDESLRMEYDAVVRRWEETRNLIHRRSAAFDEYYRMYTTYLPDKE